MNKYFLLVCFVLLSVQIANAQATLVKANNCFTEKEYQCALDNYLLTVENKQVTPENSFQVDYRIGFAYFKLKMFDKAIIYFNKALEQKPDDLSALWDVAATYYNMEKYNEAKRYYLKAYQNATDEDNKEDLSYYIGQSSFKMKNYKESISWFKKIQSRDDLLYRTDLYMGDAYYNSNQYDSALTCYLKAEEQYKTYNKDNLATILNIQGKSYKALGKYPEALSVYERVIKADPTFKEVYWNKGVVYASQKNYKDAILWYKKAIPLYEDSKESLYTLYGNISACAENMGDLEEMIKWEEKQAGYSTDMCKEYYKVAAIQYGKMKKIKDAENTCKKAIDLYLKEKMGNIEKANSYNYAKINSLLGKIKLAQKDSTAALDYFATALKISKSDFEGNAGAGEIAWQRQQQDLYKVYYSNIGKSLFDLLVTDSAQVADVYGRCAYVEANINKSNYYTTNVEYALRYDSLQKQALVLWPVLLLKNKTTLDKKRDAYLSVCNQAIKKYSKDKIYLSDLYNSKAAMLPATDSVTMKKALDESVKLNPENWSAWGNVMAYYGRYDNKSGVGMADKLISLLKNKKDNAGVANAYVYKGDFLWRISQKEDAKKAWQEALVWDSTNKSANERVKM